MEPAASPPTPMDNSPLPSEPSVRSRRAAPRRPQLSIDELQQLRWFLGGVLTWLAAAIVLHMNIDAWPLVTLAIAVSLATTLRPAIPAAIPRFVHVLAFPIMAGFFALDLWLRSELLPAVIRLDLLLLIYRALVYRQKRDDLQVIVLGLFLVVVAGVLTVSLAFTVQILAYTGCSLLLLLIITLVDAGTAQEAGQGSSRVGAVDRAAPSWAVHVNWSRLFRRMLAVTDWRILVLTATLFVGVVAGSALLFLVIPRFQLNNGMFLDQFITKKSRTGFSDSIKFGDVTEIQQDTSVALHVDVSDRGQVPRSPYWRMLVLDQYENGTFRMSPNLRAARFSPSRTGLFVDGIVRSTRNQTTWTFFLEPGVSRYLPLLGNFRQLRFAEAQTFQRAPGVGLMALVKDPVTMIAYQVQGFDLSMFRDAPEPYLPQRNSTERGALSTDEWEALHAMVLEAAGGAELPAGEFARRVGTWLRGQHGYTLSPRIPPGPRDPLLRWMESREAGHCELFAGSFVLLARAAGFPARVVTGFRGGAWNGYSNSFTVRNSDAHAWGEIFDTATRTWLRADPLEVAAADDLPGNSAEARLAQMTDRSWAARLDSLRVFWYRRVVSFDQQAQVQTLRSAKEIVQESLQRFRLRLQERSEGVKAWLRGPWDFGRMTRVAVVLLGAALSAWAGVRLRRLIRDWSFRRRPQKLEHPIRREAGRWLLKFEVRRVGASHRQDSDEGLVSDLQRLRYGASRTWPDAAAVFKRARKFTAKKREGLS